MKQQWKQPWINNAGFDSLYILLPPFLSLLLIMLLPDTYKHTAAMPVAGWVILVLLVDVAHVYSTLFRTYFNKQRFRQRKMLFTIVPVFCYVGGVLVYSMSALLFWRLLAYLAVFHFIRQQYGFLRLYSRTEPVFHWMRRVDIITVYTATLYPVVFWHLSPGRNFNWFVNGDFIIRESAGLLTVATIIYWLVLLAYVVKEVLYARHFKRFNWPRNLLIAGTIISWYAGIVYFNGDMAFTLLNVVAHGIPYMALIWAVTRKEQQARPQPGINARLSGTYGVLVFIGVMVALAYFEEGLWDALVWREHTDVFALFKGLPMVADGSLLALLVPLLSLPQTTHYLLDGFIWRHKDGPV
jgi:hypothetical protein